MESLSERLLPVARAVIGCGLIGAGMMALAWQPPGIAMVGAVLLGLLGCGSILAGAILIGPLLSEWFARPAGRLFYPEDRYDQAQPLYSVAEAKVAKQDFEGAMTFYEHISEEYPQELKAYVDRVRISVVHLHDVARAERALEQGLTALKDPQDRQRLGEMYRGLCSLAEAPAEWNRTRTLSLDRKAPGPISHEEA